MSRSGSPITAEGWAWDSELERETAIEGWFQTIQPVVGNQGSLKEPRQGSNVMGSAPTRNRQILFKSRPAGEPSAENFELVETDVPEPGEGQYLARTIYLSLDPYMRGRMSGRKSYAEPAAIGQVMVGGTVSQVVSTRHPGFASGEFIVGYDGWQEYAVSDGKGVRKLDTSQAPISYGLGVLGMPGLTAYSGLLDVGKPKPGETVVVSAASGAVGSIVGQIAKIKGCRAVGIAGSDEKCAYVTEMLGFDACINRKTDDLDKALRQACPGGIDIYFDNVAGPILAAVLRQINLGARIPLVGLISQYNLEEPPPGPNLAPLLIKRAQIQGYLVVDHQHRTGDFLRDVSTWLKEGKVKYREDVVEGLEHAPEALPRLFRGENFGKLLVKVSYDPTKGPDSPES
jgi:NADPH-dependent curcumin reductase CurA